LWQPFIIAGEATKVSKPGDRTLDTLRRVRRIKPCFGIGQLDDLQPNTLRGGVRGGLLASVALVNAGDLYRADGHRLHCSANSATWTRSCSLVAVTYAASKCPKTFHRHMYFPSTALLGTVKACALPTLQRATIKDDRTRPFSPTLNPYS